MKRLIITALAIISLTCCAGKGYLRTTRGFVASDKDCRIEVVCYSDDIVRVVKSSAGVSKRPEATASVTMTPGRVKFSIDNPSDNVVRLRTASLDVILNLEDGVLKFTDSDGNIILEESADSAGTVGQAFLLEDGEAIYGLGQHKGPGLNQRGKSYRLENANTEIAIPLVHSVKGYAVLWDNYSPTGFRSGEKGFSFRSRVGERSYFFLNGGSADGVVKLIRKLTGDAPMNPLWAFGFHQSRERYASQRELVGTVRRYRELGVPLDGIIQDWQYWGDHAHWNAVDFLNPRFPDPVGMMEEVHGMNAHALISVWPSFGPETEIFKALEAENLLLPQSTFPQGHGVRVYDPWNPRAREIFWEYMRKNLWDRGLDGWWLDATEPEHQPIRPEDYDYLSPEGTYREMRNSFPLYTVGGVYDHQRADIPGRRVMILTRSAAAGLQRYGAHVWSGDLESTWTSLREQVQEALNLSLCGVPYWNADIGGFFSAGPYPGGHDDPGFRLLYDRWMQFAVFTGMMRSHGTHTTREIFQFGDRGNPDFDVQEAAIRLRYALLPYIYSTAWKVTSEGASLMRPLFADWPEDKNTWDASEEFLFGESMLVAPVLSENGIVNVYLPKGEWFDFFTGERVDGGQSFEREVPLEQIPVYVKAGTVLPVGPDVQYASEKPWNDLQLRIYPGADGTALLYDDEGDGYGYEKGRSSRVPLKWDDASRTLTIGARKGTYPGMDKEIDFRVVIVREGAGALLDRESCDKAVHYTGKEIKVEL
jgi:alpha-D-xyloside xylohydrolase